MRPDGTLMPSTLSGFARTVLPDTIEQKTTVRRVVKVFFMAEYS